MKRVLVVTYGGGHVAAMIPLLKRLKNNNRFQLEIIGLTTAKKKLIDEGLTCKGSGEVFSSNDEKLFKIINKVIEPNQHPEIDIEDAIAYHAMGINDLILKFGEEKGTQIALEKGRFGYLPIYSAEKYLLKNKVDFLITGTCPRTELAFQKASNRIGIESLAIADNFLFKELDYICQHDYSKNLSVITKKVATQVKKNGYLGNIYVLGNPSFDNLFEEKYILEAKEYRKKLNLRKRDRLIMWAAHPPNAHIYSGRKHVNTVSILNSLTNYCKRNKNTKFLVRQHPNSNLLSPNTKFEYGYLCSTKISIETALHSIDQLVVESSTVGIQAAIIGKPVITLWHNGYPPYEENGLSKDISDLNQLHKELDKKQIPDLSKFSYPMHKSSSELLEEIVLKLT
tara:strand:- start:1696 stop:2886 length:1191 start_codon:yes stop_codon:yes gene_type:complete